MLISMTINFSGANALELIASSRVGRSRDWPIKKFCGAVSNASMRFTHFCSDDDQESEQQLRCRSDAVVARSVSVFSLPWIRQHRRAGCADHDDVQPHGGKAPMALQRSLHQNHGFLPH